MPGTSRPRQVRDLPRTAKRPRHGVINTRVVENVEGSPPTPCARVRGLPHGCSAPTVSDWHEEAPSAETESPRRLLGQSQPAAKSPSTDTRWSTRSPCGAPRPASGSPASAPSRERRCSRRRRCPSCRPGRATSTPSRRSRHKRGRRCRRCRRYRRCWRTQAVQECKGVDHARP